MNMALAGMAKDERQASGRDFWKGVNWGKSLFGRDQSDPSIKTEPMGVLGRARVKQVLGKFVTSPWTGRG